jgi:hypothetical protein
MNQDELEQRLRGWYRAEITEGPGAPPALRTAVDAIPTSVSASRARSPRTLLIAAALAVVGVAGAIAAGARVVTPPSDPPVVPSHVAVTSPAPSNSVSPSGPPSPDASPIGLASPIAVEPGFSDAGAMSVPRFQHSATLLEDGRVLIAGGRSVADGIHGSTEFWDPVSGSMAAGPSMVVPRFGHTATRLDDGRVVIIGGYGAGERGTKVVELWDPATAAFRAAGETVLARDGSLSTVLLRDGRVLIVGGGACQPRDLPEVSDRIRCSQDALQTEIWNPATEASAISGTLQEEQDWGDAALLADGRVFMLGGGHLPTLGAEIYDPAKASWSRGGAPVDNRLGSQSVTLLPDGSVAIIGGQTGTLQEEQPTTAPLASIEVWNPATSSFLRAGALAVGRERHRAVLLRDGRILVVGGFGAYEGGSSETALSEAEIWDPATGQTSSAGTSATGRGLHTATLLPDGLVLVAGGLSSSHDGDPATDTASLETWAP